MPLVIIIILLLAFFNDFNEITTKEMITRSLNKENTINKW